MGFGSMHWRFRWDYLAIIQNMGQDAQCRFYWKGLTMYFLFSSLDETPSGILNIGIVASYMTNSQGFISSRNLKSQLIQ